MIEYEFEYYTGSEIWPNVNENIIRSGIFDQKPLKYQNLEQGKLYTWSSVLLITAY